MGPSCLSSCQMQVLHEPGLWQALAALPVVLLLATLQQLKVSFLPEKALKQLQQAGH